MPSSHVDSRLAKLAVTTAIPSINFLAKGIGAPPNYHVIILDPKMQYGSCEFEDAILLSWLLGDQTKTNYAETALAKASIVWKTGMDSLVVKEQCPYLVDQQTAELLKASSWGGGVIRNGIIVGVSGLKENYVNDYSAASISELCHTLALSSMRRSENPLVFTHLGA